MFSRFFINRPIFASVLSIVITLAGGVFVWTLPIAQYPQITPPSIMVMCNYPGASAQIVAESVGAPIEQQVNGVEDMLYMSSQSGNDGSYTLTVTFKPGVDLNFAQVLVQNRVNLALPLLPDVVRQTGVTTRRRSPDILLVVSIYSPDSSRDQLYLSNFATIRIGDELRRVEGVGDVFIFGQQDYSMRIWLDPEKMAVRDLTASDVVKALREQNVQVASGQLGQEPTDAAQIQLPVSTLGRLMEPRQFAEIIVKAADDGRKVRIKDIGHVELGARSKDIINKLNGMPSTGIGVFQLPYANALDTANLVRDKMEDLKRDFPAGVDYIIAYDTTPFISESIQEVFKSLRDSIFLVALVVLLFLQSWRSTLIPLVAVPVAIVGTFAVMAAIGFSLNNLTLFGLVLAIGIVVDDAIVVVEAVEHHIEEGMTPRDATFKAMDEVSGPVIAVGLVLSAVFIPCAFISGITGQFFRQFALTIAASTLISTINSLTLSPALAAILLKPKQDRGSRIADRAGNLTGRSSILDPQSSIPVRRVLPWPVLVVLGGWLGWEIVPAFVTAWLPALADLLQLVGPWCLPLTSAALGGLAGGLLSRPLNFLLAGFFGLFNFGFRLSTSVYIRSVTLLLRGAVVALLVYAGLLGLTYWGFHQLPIGYIPTQDKGYLLASIQLPDAASLERTRAVADRVEEIAHQHPGVAHTLSVAGLSFILGANGSNFGSMFVPLKSFQERHELEKDPVNNPNNLKMHSDDIAQWLRNEIQKSLPDADVAIFGPPAVSGLGMAGGFKFIVEDRADMGLSKLQEETDKLIASARKEPLLPPPATVEGETEANKAKPQPPALKNLFTVFRANAPQLYVDVNRVQAAKLNVDLQEIFTTLQVYLGSLYVNDFNRFGRTWQVVVQAQDRFRDKVEDVKQLKVRNAQNGMVPLGTLANVAEINGPLVVTRYNMYPAAAINGATAPGISSGDAIKVMERLAERELPKGMSYEWTEITYIQLLSGNTALVLFSLAVVFVFLVLAAQYESWSLPLAVILVVPLCILGAITGVWVTNSDINIFTQVGFVVLVGLASKNAILIVEFAKHKREAGLPRRDATLEACRLRLRPILMTSFAFILGALPLLVATGAGAEMRRTLGTAVFSGMLGVTFFGIFLTPVFFYVVDRLGGAHRIGLARWRQAAGALAARLIEELQRLWAGLSRSRTRSASMQPHTAVPHATGLYLAPKGRDRVARGNAPGSGAGSATGSNNAPASTSPEGAE